MYSNVNRYKVKVKLWIVKLDTRKYINTEFQHSISSCTINRSSDFVSHAELILNTPPKERLLKWHQSILTKLPLGLCSLQSWYLPISIPLLVQSTLSRYNKLNRFLLITRSRSTTSGYGDGPQKRHRSKKSTNWFVIIRGMLSQAPVQDRVRFRRDLRNSQMGSSGF